MNLRENIKRFREEKGYSQAALARRIGVNTSLIGAFEIGTKVPSLNVMLALAKEFGCTLDELAGVDKPA